MERIRKGDEVIVIAVTFFKCSKMVVFWLKT
jgi:dTDP-4-amino-4,6-dideoxygalactose transaminase